MAEGKKIALLIDCDNVSHAAIEGVLEELAKHGVVNVRHAHGDWNSASLAGWQKKLHPHAIRPMQQFAYTKGKNATDSAMIIDAMDLLYSGSVDAFAIEGRLDEEARLRLREIAIDDTPFDSERSPEQVLGDLIAWFERRRLDARQRELNQRMRDPNADQDALLAEKQAQLLERRARLGVEPSGKA